jgi:phage tail protein X
VAIEGYEIFIVQGEYITADLIVWRRYRCRTPKLVERLLDDNPRLAKVHRYSPFLPIGMHVRIPIDPDLLAMRPKTTEHVVLIGGKSDYPTEVPKIR